jgi:hypothetical protein
MGATTHALSSATSLSAACPDGRSARNLRHGWRSPYRHVAIWSRAESVGFAPGEPAAKLVGVQVVGVAGVTGQVGDGCELGGRESVGLERQQDGRGHDMLPAI